MDTCQYGEHMGRIVVMNLESLWTHLQMKYDIKANCDVVIQSACSFLRPLRFPKLSIGQVHCVEYVYMYRQEFIRYSWYRLLHDFWLYAVLQTWGMLHNYHRYNLRWLCNIAKVSINSGEPDIRAITHLDYDWLAFFSNVILACLLVYFVSVNNVEPVFLVITDSGHGYLPNVLFK